VTVLLADDDEHTRLAMQSALENAGARVLSAESAKAALALVERADVPGVRMVLLSDLGLPRMSGYELVTELVSRRRNQQRPAMPACAVGAKTPDAAKRQAIEAGFDMFLAKPVTPERLVSAVLDLTELGLA
jgi:CheY-like chemotaxis protein